MNEKKDCFRKMGSKAELMVDLYPHPLARRIILQLTDVESLEEATAEAPLPETKSPFSFKLDDLVYEKSYFIEILSLGREGGVVERNSIKALIAKEKSRLEIRSISGLWGFESPLPLGAISEDKNIYDSLLIRPLKEVEYQKTHECFLIGHKDAALVPLGAICLTNYGNQMLIYSSGPISFPVKGAEEGKRVVGLDVRSYSTTFGLLRPLAFPSEAEKLIYPVCSFSDPDRIRLKLFEILVRESRATLLRDERSTIERAIEGYKKMASPGVIDDKGVPISVKDVTFILSHRDCLSRRKAFCQTLNQKEIHLRMEKGDLYIYPLNLKRPVLSKVEGDVPSPAKRGIEGKEEHG
jgi:hypothetical protein